ncbi:MAG: homocysteine S-methyltransferase family protein [Verrucomicrobiales bacterium]|nr:homocysteine S-methyltransferase family protein [Verrucomicrobiales bacterium]
MTLHKSFGELEQLLNERIAVIDGAMGTMLQRLGLTEADYRGARFKDWPRELKGLHDLLNVTRPEAVAEVHRQYLAAGADIIETNTFNSQAVSLADYGLVAAARELARAGAAVARGVADEVMRARAGRQCFVAGVLGPTSKTASMVTDLNDPAARGITFDELAAAYADAARGLLDGGADTLLVETIFDTLNAKAAFFAIEQVFEERGARVPLMASVTFIQAGGNRGASGQTVEAFWNSIAHVPLLSVGMNCALGPREMRPLIEELARLAPARVSCHPNAGLPDATLPSGFPETPETMARELGEWARNGWLNLVGGCCGTTPEHIRAIAAAVSGVKPRAPLTVAPALRLSGLDALTVTGEWPRVARVTLAGDEEAAVESALDQVDDGAEIIDVSVSAGLPDAARAVTRLMNLLAFEPALARKPVLLSGPEWAAVEAGLKCLQGRGAVTAGCLGEGAERARREQLARWYGAAVV